jgi:mannose-6-phosphate isomerase-like protein (cupin superfamily)
MKMKKVIIIFLVLVASITEAQDQTQVREILQEYADAWRGQEEFKLRQPVRIGFWIRTDKVQEYFITLTNDPGGKLESGKIGKYDLGFELDYTTLKLLHSGALNALTAMAQARGDEPIPLVPKFPPDFEWNLDTRGYIIPLIFHFWNRNWPEIVDFGEPNSREVHGALTTVFFYDNGLRSAWYRVEPGMHVNKKAEDQLNDFPTFIIITKGSIRGKINGKEIVLKAGQSVYIPAGMRHEFWSEREAGEFIILMFGEGA